MLFCASFAFPMEEQEKKDYIEKMNVIYISDDDDDVESIAPKLEDTATEMDMTDDDDDVESIALKLEDTATEMDMTDDDDDDDDVVLKLEDTATAMNMANISDDDLEIAPNFEDTTTEMNMKKISDDSVDIAPKLEDTATEMDMTNTSGAHPIKKDVLYKADDEDGQLNNWDMADVIKEIQDCARDMNVDIVQGVRELESLTDKASLAEETEGSEEEQDVKEEIDSQMCNKELLIFCKDASKAFFDEWGLISHQLNSFNDFISNGLQKIFDDFGEYDVEPDYNPQRRKHDGLCYWASINFGKVTVEKPSYCTKEGKNLLLKPAELRLRNMTYSSPVYVEMTTKVWLWTVGKRADV